MSWIEDLYLLAKRGEKPEGSPPWPTELDLTFWLWQTAAPSLWQETYDTGGDYSDMVAFPGIWGLTGVSYTDPEGEPDPTFAAWTMGEGGRYETNFAIPASFGYRLWSAMMLPLAQLRTIVDRTGVRYDAIQTLDSELPRLSVWGDLDPIAAQRIEIALRRRAINAARGLETERGTDYSSEALTYIFGAPVTIQWHPNVPLTRIVTVYSRITSGQKFFIRRHLPPHLNAELRTAAGHADYTNCGAYTSKYADGVGNVPEPKAIYALTSQLVETAEYL